MADTSIYRDLAERTSHTFYLGVIGPVRTGKSTFIKKFMEAAVYRTSATRTNARGHGTRCPSPPPARPS